MTDELEVTGSPMENQDIMTMIDFTDKGEYTKATEIFNDQLMQRMDDALDAQKIAMADKMFNGGDEDDQMEMDLDADEEDEDEAVDVDVDVDDEEIDAMADEMEDNP